MSQAAALIPTLKDRTGEFVISVGDDACVAGSTVVRVGDVSVSVFPGLSIVHVLNADGGEIGLFLGTVIDYRNEKSITGSVSFVDDESSTQPDRGRRVEDFVYSFGGRWVFLHAEHGIRRLYLDADGSNSVVFDATRRRASSTTGLLLDDDEYVARFDRELHESLDVPRDGWFPSGLTAHHGVRRLLCNHALDLETWETVRHWPVEDFVWTDDVAGHAARIVEIVRSTSRVLVAGGRVAAALTAGNETRFLLASMRPFASDVEFVTMNAKGARLDVHHAAALAERFGLQHRLLTPCEATPDEMVAWQYRVGHTVGGNNMRLHPSIKPLSAHDSFLGGLGGEIGRGFFWRPGDDDRTVVDARSVVARFGMPAHQRVLDATESWLETVQDFSPLTQLDLAYLELRMSAWAFAQAYAQDSIVGHIHPMICRESYRLMLELPPDAKRSSRFIREGIAYAWPELLDLPINKYGDRRDVVALLRKLADPARVMRRLRRRHG